MAKVRVYYKGLSDVRELTVEQLREHNIEVSRDLVWDARTPAISIDAPDELIQLLTREQSFTITEIKDDNTLGDDIVVGRAVDDSLVSANIVDATTGQKSANPNAGDDED